MNQFPPQLTILNRRKRWTWLRWCVRRLLAGWDRWRRRPWTVADPEPLPPLIVWDDPPVTRRYTEGERARLRQWWNENNPNKEKPLD